MKTINFRNYKLKTAIEKEWKFSAHESEDVKESVCSFVSKTLEEHGKASCIHCLKPSCIVNFQDKVY